jgi:hypothetical protein
MMTEAEIVTLTQKLERCEFTPGEFHHGDHLAVSAAHLYAADFAVAMENIRNSLTSFISHHGLNGYNETITRFWMEQVAQRLDRRLSLPESVERIQAELGDKDLIYRYYSKERLNSPEAKENWVEPDGVAASGQG